MKRALLLTIPLALGLFACERPADRRQGGMGGGPVEEQIEQQQDRIERESDQAKKMIEQRKDEAEMKAKQDKQMIEDKKDIEKENLDAAKDQAEHGYAPTAPTPRPLIP